MSLNESWVFDRELAACFGPGVSFAAHPADEQHAFELLGLLRRAGFGWNEVSQRILSRIRGADPEHIRRQMDRAEKMLRPWLID